MDPEQPERDKLPDPWLFDSEALLRELDRCRETVLQIPINNPNATHFGIQLAVASIWNLSQNPRYILHLFREGQRAFRKKHEQALAKALSQPHNSSTTHPATIHNEPPSPISQHADTGAAQTLANHKSSRSRRHTRETKTLRAAL
jgi:hypothetical protein